MFKRRVSAVALAALLLTAVAGCGSESRPTVDEWRPLWDGIVDGIPTPADLGDPPDQDVCTSALAMLREQSQELFPTPDLAIDPTVREWVQIAEDAFFACPPSSSQIPTLEFALGELDRLEAEVDAVLAIDEGG